MAEIKDIRLQNLTIGYQVKGNQKKVAQHITADIHCGELTCLIGRNGVGKSTLLRTLSGFQPALDGDIIFEGEQSIRLQDLTDKELSRFIGVVLTEKPDVRNMTARELIELGRSPYTGFWGGLTAEDHDIAAEAIRQVGIESLADRMVHTLSDGERQKVMIAKALAQQTPVIFLDEPTAFLDFPSKVETMQLLGQLAREQHKVIFLSTHDVELTLQLADRLWLMERNEQQPVCIGTPAELTADGTLSRSLNYPLPSPCRDDGRSDAGNS